MYVYKLLLFVAFEVGHELELLRSFKEMKMKMKMEMKMEMKMKTK